MSAGGRKRKNVSKKPELINTFQINRLLEEEEDQNAHPGRRFLSSVHGNAIQRSGIYLPIQNAKYVKTGVPLYYGVEEDDVRNFQASHTGVPQTQNRQVLSNGVIVPSARNPTIYRLSDGQAVLIAPESVSRPVSVETVNIGTRHPVLLTIPSSSPGHPETKLASPSEPRNQGFVLQVDPAISLGRQYSPPQNISLLTSPLSSATGQPPILLAIPLPGNGLSPTDKIIQSPMSDLENKTMVGHQPHLDATMSPPYMPYGSQTSHYSSTSPLVSPLPTIQPPLSGVLFAIPMSGPGLSPTDIYSPPSNMPAGMVAEPQLQPNAAMSSQGARQFLNPTPSNLLGEPQSNLQQSRVLEGVLASNSISPPSSLPPQMVCPSSMMSSKTPLNLSRVRLPSSSSQAFSPSSYSNVFQCASNENQKVDPFISAHLLGSGSSPTSPYKPSQHSLSDMTLSRSKSTGSSQDPISPSSSHGLDSERTLLSPNDSTTSSKQNQSNFSLVDLLIDEQPFADHWTPLSNSTRMPSSTMTLPGQGLKSDQSPVSPMEEANNNTITSPGFGITQMQSQFASLDAASATPQSEDVYAFDESPPYHDSEQKTRIGKSDEDKLSSSRTFQCSTCYKEFEQNISLKNHERSHRANKNHFCRFCKEPFHYKAHLRRHERIHAKQLHICRYCGITLECDYDLVQHEREHRQNNDNMLSIYAKSGAPGKKAKAGGSDPPPKEPPSNDEKR